jgi:hypothetical protein
MTEQEIEKKVDESIAWIEERVSLEKYAKELIKLQFIHRIKQLTLADVSKSFFCQHKLVLDCKEQCFKCKKIVSEQ